jgi:hypothetical protein
MSTSLASPAAAATGHHNGAKTMSYEDVLIEKYMDEVQTE